MGIVTSPIFHCVFNIDGSIHHFMHEDMSVFLGERPNTYVICIAENKHTKVIKGGIILKTTSNHTDSNFPSLVYSACISCDALRNIVCNEGISILPTKIAVNGEQPLSESECLDIMVTQYIKHSARGVQH